MNDQILVYLCTEKREDRRQKIRRQRIGMSMGVLIHSQLHARLFSSNKAVRANRVTKWMTLMAQPWTEAIAKGVKMRRK
jgi:hypothetical protein